MRFRAAPSHPIDTHSSPHQYNTHHARASAASSHCRVPGSAWTGRPRITLERQRCGDGRRRGASGDRGTDASDDDGGGGVDERGIACASRAQTRVSVSRAHEGSSSRGTRVWAGMGRRTLARTVALAARAGPPNPPVRAGPIHGMGRARTFSSAHPFGSVVASRVRRDGKRIACARTIAREPPNTCANGSSCHEDHEDMGSMLGGAQIETQHSWQCRFESRSTPAAVQALAAARSHQPRMRSDRRDPTCHGRARPTLAREDTRSPEP